MQMPGRVFSSASYRYGFNGQEKDNEIKGDGNSLDFKFRVYDSRLGKFLSVDPLAKSYPWNSPYAFAENKPIAFIDLEGSEALWYQVSLDAKTGEPIIKHVDTKTSWLDPFVPFHLVVSINGGGYQYYDDFTQSQIDAGEMKEALNWIAKNPTQAQAKIEANYERGKADAAKRSQETEDLFANAFTIAWGVRRANTKTSTVNSSKSSGGGVSQETINKATTRVTARVGGMRDRKSGSFKAYLFGSRNNGTNSSNSDQDLLILTENPSFFGSGRGAEILQSIKADYKATTGLDLDVNVMTSQQYNRAKGGEFKKSVEANKTEIKVE